MEETWVRAWLRHGEKLEGEGCASGRRLVKSGTRKGVCAGEGKLFHALFHEKGKNVSERSLTKKYFSIDIEIEIFTIDPTICSIGAQGLKSLVHLLGQFRLFF